MIELLNHLFFSLTVYGLVGFLVWATWDSDNLFVRLMTLIALLVAVYVSSKERKWAWGEIAEDAIEKIDDEDDYDNE